MTGDAFDEFAVILANLSPGNAPKWNAGLLKIYEAGLREIPNSAASALAEAVIDDSDFRPGVSRCKELYRQITASSRRTALDVIAEIAALRDKFGEYGDRPDPTRNIYRLGPPASLSDEARSVVALWGGWCAFCQDDSPGGVQRGHLLKAAQAVCDGAASDTMRRLQLEYQEERAALPAPALLLEHSPEPLPMLETRQSDASAPMQRAGGLLPALPLSLTASRTQREEAHSR